MAIIFPFEQNKFYRVLLAVLFFIFLQACRQQRQLNIQQSDKEVTVTTSSYKLVIQKAGFRYSFQKPDGSIIAGAHPVSGIQIGSQDQPPRNIQKARLVGQSDSSLAFDTETQNGIKASVTIWFGEHTVKVQVRPDQDGRYTILGRTDGIKPAYGLADHAAFGHEGDLGVRSKAELTGFKMDTLRGYRMISNFVIFPQQGFAEVNIEPGDKRVGLTDDENVQGSENVRSLPGLYYFIGTPKQIYRAFLKVRDQNGYPVDKPKYEWFGVGWEAFGALAWNTNQKTVTDNVEKYLDLGYPLRWMVVGSGFWPRGEGSLDQNGTPYGSETKSTDVKKLEATTSFGLWDHHLYPSPQKMIRHFHNEGLKFMLGLRIGFIPGGPFTGEGLKKGYFLSNDHGDARLFKVGFPRSKVYLLDTKNPNAVSWYVRLCHKWMDYGVDGFKEDLYGYPQWLPDDMLNPVNEALMNQGVYVMGRNNYLGSPVDIQRFNDFNYNQIQDRGPINGLAYAYSGFPDVYPDIVGGTGITKGRFGDQPRKKLEMYLMRESMYDALNPSMSFGYGPWNFGAKTNSVCLKAARLHAMLQPYIYSNAIKAYRTGFPYPLTPLPLVYPDDPGVYGLADTTRRSYEWMIGESLLATPLYGNDYATAKTRDVYLPPGKWIDYDSGKVYEGPKTLRNFELPVDKIPLFVGGKGIIVDQENGALICHIYPVNKSTSDVFYGSDGITKSIISIDHPDWNHLKVIDLNTKKHIPWKWLNHSYAFKITNGHNYKVE